AVKQHLLRLYQKFRIPEGANRRTRLANEVIAMGLVRPLPPVHVPHQGRPPMDGRVPGVRTAETRRPGHGHGPTSRPAPSTAGRRAS
ncbi:forkhead-associated protein, partial [Micromonospora aurantiaca]|nr:forkhead-associated protein [Micromonospora aurantiaca]